MQMRCNRLASSRTPQPFQSRPWGARRCRGAGVVVSAEEAKRDPAKAPLISSKDIGTIPYLVDNESFTDLMAFSGPAPERINGRVAMWAFLICSLQELLYGQSVVQQFQAHPVATVFLGLTLSVASVAPKYVSGVSLNDLQEAASRDGLPQALRFFNKTHEIWLGRVAMLGLVGLAGLELYLGHPLFHR